MVWGLLSFAFGMAYEWLSRQELISRRGFLSASAVGAAVALILILAGVGLGLSPTSLPEGVVWSVLSLVVLTGVFLLGAAFAKGFERAAARSKDQERA